MKFYHAPIFLFLLLVMGCSGTKASKSSPTSVLNANPCATVTTDCAQRALNQFINNNGAASILGGVQETSPNSAVADLTVSGFQYGSQENPYAHTYNGPGRAEFARFTDGKWVLQKVTIGGSFNAYTWNPNIELR